MEEVQEVPGWTLALGAHHRGSHFIFVTAISVFNDPVRHVVAARIPQGPNLDELVLYVYVLPCRVALHLC